MNPDDIGTTVTSVLEPDAPMTVEELAEIAALEGRPIDLSDIPESPPDALWIRTGPGNLLGRLMAEARERERDGGPFDNIERLMPETIARVAAMKDHFLDFSDMPEMAPYALALLAGDGPGLERLTTKPRETACAAA